MKLFDETENKYYEMLSYMLAEGKTLTVKNMNEFLENYLSGEVDFDVVESLFPKTEGEEILFFCEEGKYYPVMDTDFPIRNNRIELQAVRNLAADKYMSLFLSEHTMEKINALAGDIPVEWKESDICIKNQFKGGINDSIDKYKRSIFLIAKAIREKTAIVYDNVKSGKYEYRDEKAFPLKIEYSAVNDQFRIYAYHERDAKFLKMNLGTMDNIRETDERMLRPLMDEFISFCEKTKRKVILEVEPRDNVIERCFRVFSYYNRKALFDKEENKYTLEIEYPEYDEREVIRDILAMGDRAVVVSPDEMQKKVYERIVAARNQYL